MTMVNATNNTAAVVDKAVAAATQGMVPDIWLAIGIITSILLVGFTLFVFLTPIGKESVGRWVNKKKYAKGGYTNALIFTKDGMCKEVFKANDHGYFQYNKVPYIRVPTLSFPYKGIPTLAYIEGTTSPIDIYSRDRTDLMSCYEVDTVMNQQSNFDMREWLKRNSSYILIFAGIVIIGIGAILYFNYNIFEWVRDTAPNIAEGVREVAKSKVS